jgi:hypothetical protein
MQTFGKGQLELETRLYPECLVLWRCIGCGAMGNEEPCAGSCKFRKLEIVGAAEYAELVENFDAIKEQAKRLQAMVGEIAGLGEEQSDHENAYRELQTHAREFLRSSDRDELSGQDKIGQEFEPATVWLCATCGQVEAPQSCLGVCIRRNGEFLRADHYFALAIQIEEEQRHAREILALVRQLAWVAPHSGQWEKTCLAFKEKATKLMHSNPPSPSELQRAAT